MFHLEFLSTLKLKDKRWILQAQHYPIVATCKWDTIHSLFTSFSFLLKNYFKYWFRWEIHVHVIFQLEQHGLWSWILSIVCISLSNIIDEILTSQRRTIFNYVKFPCQYWAYRQFSIWWRFLHVATNLPITTDTILVRWACACPCW